MLGRADDVINVAAHRISTMEIEAVVTAHPDVVEAAVVGVPDDDQGHRADRVRDPARRRRRGRGGGPRQIRPRSSREMGGYARLDRIYVTPAMPKTRTGKTMRRLLRDLVVHGKPTGDTSAMEDPAALEAVAAVVNR